LLFDPARLDTLLEVLPYDYSRTNILKIKHSLQTISISNFIYAHHVELKPVSRMIEEALVVCATMDIPKSVMVPDGTSAYSYP